MSFNFRGREIGTVGVVGSGQIGPDIALHFSKALAPHGVRVVVVDIAKEALEKGKARLERKVDKGIEAGAFKPDQGLAMKDAVAFTTDYTALQRADIVVEAATESAEIKAKIFRQLSEICRPDTILASNSSHIEPEVVAEFVGDPSRSLVIHYFFPAERNLALEVVPGEETDPDLTRWLLAFYERIGKVPIEVKSRYGYAIDPIFEGLFLAAALAAEEGLGTTKEVDTVATRALGQRVGPFTAMNLTGGNPITAHGLNNEGQKIMPWFQTPASLNEKVETGENWEVPARGEVVEVSPAKEDVITRELQGAYLGLCDEILSSGIVTLADLEMEVELALDMIPPAKLANRLGVGKAWELARDYADKHDGFKPPRWLAQEAKKGGPIEVPVVLRRDQAGVAVLTIRRPKSLNSLDEAAFSQIGEQVVLANQDPVVKAIVLTGFGVKAFVSGADVNFLSRIDSPESGMAGARDAQATGQILESSGKPIVCALNGVAFGGGLEMAMCCTARIAAAGLRVLGAQPEVNLGIIPGAGGTQRLPRLVGLFRASELLRTGRPVSSEEALQIGLVSELADPDRLLDRAIELARQLADGVASVPAMQVGPLPDVPGELPSVELGHLSRRIDAILSKAILEGARNDLESGLRIETEQFGEVCRTQDMKIGIETFLTKGPREKALFVHA